MRHELLLHGGIAGCGILTSRSTQGSSKKLTSQGVWQQHSCVKRPSEQHMQASEPSSGVAVCLAVLPCGLSGSFERHYLNCLALGFWLQAGLGSALVSLAVSETQARPSMGGALYEVSPMGLLALLEGIRAAAAPEGGVTGIEVQSL